MPSLRLRRQRAVRHCPLVGLEPDLLIRAVGGAALIVFPPVNAVAERGVGPGGNRGPGDGFTMEAIYIATVVFGGDLLAGRHVKPGVVLEDVAANRSDGTGFV